MYEDNQRTGGDRSPADAVCDESGLFRVPRETLALALALLLAITAGFWNLGHREGGSHTTEPVLQASVIHTAELGAPRAFSPACGSQLDRSQWKVLDLQWTAVSGATSYVLEVDCFGCQAAPRTWHSASSRLPWLLRAVAHDELTKTRIDMLDRLEAEGGLMLRWRVTGVDDAGRPGEIGPWCRLGLASDL